MKKLYLLLTILIINSFVYASGQASKPASQQEVLKSIANIKQTSDFICNIASIITMLGVMWLMEIASIKFDGDISLSIKVNQFQGDNRFQKEKKQFYILSKIIKTSTIIGGVSGLFSLFLSKFLSKNFKNKTINNQYIYF